MNELPNRRLFMDRITEDDVFEAEKTVLACILASNELMSECGLEWSDFVEGLHQTVFDKIGELVAGHQVANSVSLKPFLPRAVDKLPFTPAEYVENLFLIGSSPARKAQFEASLQIIKGQVMARQIGQEAQYMATVASEGHGLLTIGDEIEQLESRLKELRARFAETTAISSPGSSYLSAFQASSRRDGVIGVPIALPEIARVLSEPVFEAGNLYGLLSSSGEGKSSLTMQLIYHAVREGHPVLFLSYDQSSAQCVRQMIAQVHGIDVRQQREPSRLMSQKEQDQCVSFATWIDRQPLEIIRCQREGVSQLVAYSRRFIKKRANGRTPFLVIDHIGKVKPKNDKLSADRISGDVTAELKALADETSSAVLILNQRNSFGTRRDNPRPIAADLYGGEGAKADYDGILYLYRAEKYKAEREAIAATDADWKKIHRVFTGDLEGIAEIGSVKCRFGDATIKERVRFEARFTRYVSMQPERERELF
ncbi:DnaB-like helicase C-terminal domain-containing protein [Rhizobium sp. MHM7A]|uniref:DnaB-like helicase C-terminal domain-containing protein n=1 Tax=Rhizobium sp. MHM7A TaxID=2583233 RepID=UPI001106EE14|nr:DnaB-like helicase C-terminal domain-containing protein [Rhizobium sp. MHM7A]TLX12121.1 helicase DnaB [Rhizobium sp. MHM7A]